MPANLLILGGTTEAYELAERLAGHEDWHVINSLAGRTANPRRPAGETRIGGFGGVAGLARYLDARAIRAVIDVTHPFAAQMGWNAAEACQLAGVPLLRLERPAWMPEPGDRWASVATWEAAAEALRQGGARRVLLAVGRQELAPFAGIDGLWFLIRLVTPPDPEPPFRHVEWLYSRGPFVLDDERALLDTWAIDTLVCKNSGGEATSAKLVAARERGIRVVMLQRPVRPAEVATTATVAATLAWLDALQSSAYQRGV
ncbi:cobalt-precorrin-6A reductase [Allochromatium palmeri]|uniref:Cobalt-precorrin-6A reductase n=1 Tax=Allochromatium palmeri TaxID=231048 RepID=A0A6N8EFB0_9GAMM|nr:cobalt-precorrin-6A reductase [Allochromatium palmeri]MTW21227.1 cobalt-precorrin-6A reductase [Allochromatium palmeri]